MSLIEIKFCHWFVLTFSYANEIWFDLKDSDSTEAAVEATEPLANAHADADTLDVEGLRVRLLALNEVLEQAREDAITSKLQLARFQRQHQNYLEKHELQIQTLNRLASAYFSIRFK